MCHNYTMTGVKLLITTALLLAASMAFQNCGNFAEYRSSQDQNTGSQKIIDDARNFNQVAFEFDYLSGSYKSSLNLTTGVLTSKSKSCQLEAFRLEKLANVLSESKICQPGPLPEGAIVCLAIAIPDIKLTNATNSIELAKEICHTGTFLCQDKDALFRSLLEDISKNPPAGCL